ncbi:conserved hypothetical protein [Vibrio crassostreae]|uniref:hypothetical protein n=1 Tax=Vibrio TaxID=662 RepID=UPI0003112A5D|nr:MULTISPECIES: hypothetical protein [Vibrio]OEF30249.1 hypothetical protein OA9_09195 [Vibrio cyclitrophicus 1F97]OEF76677.1 hypothetical protein OA5_20000 [Vibrio cyclitrophicus 1F111]ROO57466.1 hypothetical protein EDB56_101611 [Vibrio crassostreae]ROR63992.1 hypothetical protein EDB59_2803 [Vibrio crassostreae]CAK3162433.1 conserved hypothetical protein [Vibrio crassostreae]
MEVNFENGKLSSLYFHELFWLASSIVSKSEKLFEDSKIPDSGYLIQVSPELHSLIASILSDAANIKKLLVTPSVKLKGESGAQARIRKERAKHLNEAIAPIEPKELFNHKVRNTLEHFDEYLDEANVKLTKSPKAPSPMAAYNMILSHWDAFSPRVYPVRLYISSERTFYNMKWSVNIGELHNEAKDIVEKLSKLPRLGGNGEIGALMLRLDT